MNLGNFFTTQYLFSVNTVYISPTEKLFFLAGAVLVLLGVVLKISAAFAPTPVDKKFRNKFYNLFLTIGLSELGWYFFRYENVPYVDTLFVAWLVILIAIIWAIVLLVKAFKNYSKEKEVWGKEQVKLRYLPK